MSLISVHLAISDSDIYYSYGINYCQHVMDIAGSPVLTSFQASRNFCHRHHQADTGVCQSEGT